MAALAVQNAMAGSAVASDERGPLISFHGCGVEEARRRSDEPLRLLEPGTGRMSGC